MLLQKYTNLEFLRPLSEVMTSQIPQDRPTAEASLTLFKEIIKPISGKERRWHLRPNPSYKSSLAIICDEIKYSRRRAESFSHAREFAWQIRSRIHHLAGKELIWPVHDSKVQQWPVCQQVLDLSDSLSYQFLLCPLPILLFSLLCMLCSHNAITFLLWMLQVFYS